jgi:hypothetical protein
MSNPTTAEAPFPQALQFYGAPLFERLLNDVGLAIQQLNLMGISQACSIGTNVFVKGPNRSDFTDIEMPCVICVPDGQEEILEDQETFESLAWGYPVGVLVVDRESNLDPNVRPDFLSWRHDAMAAFANLPATGTPPYFPDVPECYTLSVRPRSIFEEWADPKLPAMAVLVTSFVVVGHCNESYAKPASQHTDIKGRPRL